MSTTGKTKIEPKPHHSIIISEPMVRDYSTGGGHGPEDLLVEGDRKVKTKKWQGYPPKDLNIVGKPIPPVPEISVPRYTGKAEYATRVLLPNMLYIKTLRSIHPHARITRLDTSRADKMPGVKAIITHKNAPSTNPLRQEPMYQGDLVAVAAAETEDLAEDAVRAIEIEYEILPHITTIDEALSPDAPKLRPEGNLLRMKRDDPRYHPTASAVFRHGDLEKGFKESDVIREFTYQFTGARLVPMQPVSCAAKWDGDVVTCWGLAQSVYGPRSSVARWLGIDPRKVRLINKYNGGSFGGVSFTRIAGFAAHIAKLTGRPVKYSGSIEETIAEMNLKPFITSKFKVGAKKDGRIMALRMETIQLAGDIDVVPNTGGPLNESARDQFLLYGPNIPNWEHMAHCYKSNTPPVGANRSNTQQEFKWGFENMMSEMAEAVGIDPAKFRLMHVAKPGQKLDPAKDWGAEFAFKPETEKGTLTFDSYASTEIIEEATKVFGWDRRNPKPGSMPGRFKRGMGMTVSDHHSGHLGWRDGEFGFARERETFGAEVEVDAKGFVTLKNALPCSGTDHDSGMAMTVSEMLGFTNLEKTRVVWGDSALAPSTGQWYGGRTNTLQGGAVLSATEKLKLDLLGRASKSLGVPVAELETKDGVIWSKKDRNKKVTFADLAKDAGGSIIKRGECVSGPGKGRALVRSLGACFVELEVDTWTGMYRVVKVVYSQDSGKVINPLLAEGDMDGSFIQSLNFATDALPYDREFPGHALFNVGFLSYRMPTIKEFPDDITQIFIDSLEPRWFFGYKSFAETTIGAVPAAIGEAVYNATGVRIREHPITPAKILAGLKEKERR